MTTVEHLGELLVAKSWQLTLAESCTGGWIAKQVTDIAGVSVWFDSGFVTYSDAAKHRMLGVDPEIIAQYGAVSEPCAKAMAQGALACSDANIALSVTGIAGPGGGSVDKPVGTVWFGIADCEGLTCASSQLFSGDRMTVRSSAVAYATQWLVNVLERANINC